MDQILDVFGRVRPSLVLGLHVAIASWVTLHALLHKREVGGTLGWIGLAWLSPFFGGFLYVMLGINRVKRRARRLLAVQKRRAPRLASPALHDGPFAALERALGKITHRRAEDGNRVIIFHNGDAAYPAMLEAIDRARTSIGLSSYIFNADVIGGRFINALSDARKRGVAVRVIIDGVGGGYVLSPAYEHLRRAGVDAGRFMHSSLPWRMPLLNLRSHKKILVIDGTIGFTGGMNIADENRLATSPAEPVQDTHFKVTGPVVAQLVGAFAHDWSFVTGEDLEGIAWFPALPREGPSRARIITSGPDEDIEKIEFAILQAIACSRDAIHVMTPYFLPDDQVITALALAAMRGVSVSIVIPSASNHRLVDWATRATIEPILEAGARVWLGAPPFQHSKMMVVDGQWSLIGSSNWDLRSLRLNFELCMEVYDQTLAETLRAFVIASQGELLTRDMLSARVLPVRLRDAAVRLLMPYL